MLAEDPDFGGDTGCKMQDGGYLIPIEFLEPCALRLTPYTFGHGCWEILSFSIDNQQS